jgi:hypothetical protein
VIDGKVDLIHEIFHGLESLYFCPSTSFTVESALAVLLTTSESDANFIGHLLFDRVELLSELIQHALAIDNIQLLLQVISCTYPKHSLQIYRSVDVSSSLRTEKGRIEMFNVSVPSIEMTPEKIWFLLLWGELLQLGKLIQECRKQLDTFFISTENVPTNSARLSLIFQGWNLSDFERSELIARLTQHFTQFRSKESANLSKSVVYSLPNQVRALKTPLNVSSDSFISGNAHIQQQGLTIRDLSTVGNTTNISEHQNKSLQDSNHVQTMSLQMPTIPIIIPPEPPVQSVFAQSVNKSRSTVSNSNSPASVMDIDRYNNFVPSTKGPYGVRTEDDDTGTIDSWGTYADESSRLRALRRKKGYSGNPSQQNLQKTMGMEETPQRKIHAPMPIPPHSHPFPSDNSRFEQDNNHKDSSHSHNSVLPMPYTEAPQRPSRRQSPQPEVLRPRSRSASPIVATIERTRNSSSRIRPRSTSPIHSKHSEIATQPVSAGTSSEEKLALSREIALLRLRHAKIQQELEKSRLQAAQAMKMTNLQSLALKTAVIRVSSASPVKTRPMSGNKHSPQHRNEGNSLQEMDLYEQARKYEFLRQEALTEQARQRCIQRIQQKKAEEKAQSSYHARQQQYKQSLQRQQREKHVSELLEKQQQGSPSLSLSQNDGQKSTERKASEKRVTFDSPNRMKHESRGGALPATGKVKDVLENNELPIHPDQHHRYSMAALNAVAHGISPTRVAITNTSLVTKSQIRPPAATASLLTATGTPSPAEKLAWPSAAQLQKIKQRQQQLRQQQAVALSSSLKDVNVKFIGNKEDNSNNSVADAISNTINFDTNRALKPPKRDISPSAAMSASLTLKNSRPVLSNIGSMDVTNNQRRIGGKHSPPRSIADFDTCDSAPAPVVSVIDDAVNDEYVAEMSLGMLRDLLDERCLGPIQQVYLLLKIWSNEQQLDVIRSPSVTCLSIGTVGHVQADFQGACIHFSIPSVDSEAKVIIEVYAQQMSVADECIASTEVALSSLLPSSHLLPSTVQWQKLQLCDPHYRDRSAGDLELAVNTIALYV